MARYAARIGVIGIALWVAGLSASAAAAPLFVELSLPPGASPSFVTPDGSSVYGTLPGNAWFRWTVAGGLETLVGPAGASRVLPSASSTDGAVVVGWLSPSTGRPTDVRGFRWTASSGFELLAPFAGDEGSLAADVSGDGSRVVGTSTRFGGMPARAVAWDATGGVSDVLPAPENLAGAMAISADGRTILGRAGASGSALSMPFVTRDGILLAQGPPSGSWLFAGGAVTPDGSYAVGFLNQVDVPLPIEWTEATGITEIHWTSPPFMDLPIAVSADGRLVFGYYSRARDVSLWDRIGGTSRPFEDVLTNDYGIDLAGADLSSAAGMSDDARVYAGTAVRAGTSFSWVAIVPEPSTATLLGLGAALLGAHRRPRSRAYGRNFPGSASFRGRYSSIT